MYPFVVDLSDKLNLGCIDSNTSPGVGLVYFHIFLLIFGVSSSHTLTVQVLAVGIQVEMEVPHNVVFNKQVLLAVNVKHVFAKLEEKYL